MGELECKRKKAGKGRVCLGKVVSSVMRLSGRRGVRKREVGKINLEEERFCLSYF